MCQACMVTVGQDPDQCELRGWESGEGPNAGDMSDPGLPRCRL